jgi:hypothetical protein
MQPFNPTQKLLTQEFKKAGLKILPNESGGEVLFSVQTSTGKTHDIYLQTINLNRVTLKFPSLHISPHIDPPVSV